MFGSIKLKLRCWYLRNHKNKTIKVDESETRRHVPFCPHCRSEITQMSYMYGQKSYSCVTCGHWGPWKERLRIKNLHWKRKRKGKRKGKR